MEFRRAVESMANANYKTDEPLAGLLASYDRAKFQRPKFPLWGMIRDDERQRRDREGTHGGFVRDNRDRRQQQHNQMGSGGGQRRHDGRDQYMDVRIPGQRS